MFRFSSHFISIPSSQGLAVAPKCRGFALTLGIIAVHKDIDLPQFSDRGLQDGDFKISGNKPWKGLERIESPGADARSVEFKSLDQS